MIGTKLTHFEVTGRIGEGGMGVVYLARDLSLGRQVAIKLLPEGNTQDPDSLRRFLAEAKAASALNHPNIVTVYEVSHDAGRWFIAMEYVQGKTLGDLIPPGGLPLQQALKYASQTADALAAAHAAGVIHRDVKPGNIMVTDSGVVKVLDFGLAKLAPQAGPQDRTVRAEPATIPGTILGTFDYMSPEQAEGKEAGPRSDIFSFGAVLFEMLTGSKAFRRDSQAATLTAVMRDDPPALRQHRNDLPQELEALLSGCLRKQPERRIAGMREVHETLERLAAVPAPSPFSYRKVVVALVVVAGISAALYLRTPAPVPQEALRTLPLTNFPGTEVHPSFSPDGKQVAFSWNSEKQDNFDIYVKYLDSPAALRLTTDPGPDIQPAWSPDGRWIAFLRALKENWRLNLVSPHGSEERTILVSASRMGGGIAWSPDSRFLMFAQQANADSPMHIRRFHIESGNSAQVTFPAQGQVGDSGPSLSPDGKTLIYTRTKGNTANADVLALDLNANGEPQGEAVTWLSGFFAPTFITWVPGGDRVLFVSSYSSFYSVWQSRIVGNGRERKLAQPVRVEGLPGVRSIAITRQGPPFGLAFESLHQDINLRTVRLPDGVLSTAPVGGSTFNEEAGSYSPDGTRIAFRSNRDGDVNLWISNADGTGARQLTRYKSHNIGSSAWSPDGREVAFGLSNGGDINLYRVDAETGASRELLATSAHENNPRWSPDGRWIYFNSDRSGQSQIWRMPAAGGEPQQVTTTGAANAKFSPDGKYLYFRLNSGSTGSLWRMPVEGGPSEKVVDRVIWTNWVVTAEGIYYTDYWDVWFLPHSGKIARHITKSPVRIGAGLDLHPDGKTLLLTLIEGSQASELMYVPNFR